MYVDEHGLQGSNFYWEKRESYGISDEEMQRIGIFDSRAQIAETIVAPLLTAHEKFRRQGYQLFIKEGCRPRALYELMYAKRIEKFGKQATDKIINMRDMPHATGKTVDVALLDLETGKQIYMRRAEDGDAAFFVDFYKTKSDALSSQYHHLQELTIGIMQECGFRLGTKREYFHFDYRPELPPNYDRS